MNYKPKKCTNCGNEFKQYNSLQKYCSYSCSKVNIKKEDKKFYQIPKISKRQSSLLRKYSKLRKEFLKKPKNNRCPVFPMHPVVDVHHAARKVGYADNWAKENDIPLLLDTRFWIGVSRKGHNWIHNNEKEAEKLGLIIRVNVLV